MTGHGKGGKGFDSNILAGKAAGTELRHRVGLVSVGHSGRLCFADEVQVALGVVSVGLPAPAS